jgi:hypothetical protein
MKKINAQKILLGAESANDGQNLLRRDNLLLDDDTALAALAQHVLKECPEVPRPITPDQPIPIHFVRNQGETMADVHCGFCEKLLCSVRVRLETDEVR